MLMLATMDGQGDQLCRGGESLSTKDVFCSRKPLFSEDGTEMRRDGSVTLVLAVGVSSEVLLVWCPPAGTDPGRTACAELTGAMKR